MDPFNVANDALLLATESPYMAVPPETLRNWKMPLLMHRI